MIIYSVTVNIKKDIEDSWLNWMKDIHIKDVMNTGYFIDWEIKRQILPENSTEESTYVINYKLKTLQDYSEYIANHAQRLQNEHKDKFSDKFNAIRTVYEIISE